MIYNNIRPPEAAWPEPQRPAEAQRAATGQAFEEILNEHRLQFSKHASARLNSRDCALTSDQLRRVAQGVRAAGEKGVRDSLVFVDHVALVVDVRSSTVITAMNTETERLFTNIDGAVIV